MQTPAYALVFTGAGAIQLGRIFKAEYVFHKGLTPVVDVADQEAWRQTQLRHFIDLFIMQNAAMFDSTAHGGRVEPLRLRLGKSI